MSTLPWRRQWATLAVFDDVAVDLQHPQSPEQLLVDGPCREPAEVVEVARERRRPAIPRELLRARLYLGHDGDWRKREEVLGVDGQRDGREPLHGPRRPTPRELEARRQ